ncbi:MAG TPA: hypothetical protein RMH99_09550 [Sandaracinaceae bacterium LLY-WYZ-13_1]|nr:hypothetical protein [Sandaracinaceae bacterium LLY-WYZ-13_1]
MHTHRRRRRRALGIGALACASWLAGGCGADSEGSARVDTSSRPSEPTETAEPAPPPARAPSPPPPDLTGFSELTVRVLRALDGPWARCGVTQVVGHVEVEVLGVPPPAPRLVLRVTCPASLGGGGLLSRGQRLHVTLRPTVPGWPASRPGLPAGLPVRDVRTASDAMGVVRAPR